MRLVESVVDRLAEEVQQDYPPSTNRLLQISEQLPTLFPELRDLLLQYPTVPSREVIAPFSVPQVLRLEDAARHSPFPPIHSLIGYFVIDPRRQLNAIGTGELLARLNQVRAVDVAYRESEVRNATLPKVTPSDETIYPAGYHGHFFGSFEGINAIDPAVWGLYDGGKVGFVDLEAGWNLNHDDLPKPAPPFFNQNSSSEQSHGAAALGVVVGQDNGKGVVGIAPNATLRKVVSHIRPGAMLGDMDNWDIVAAILDALSPGVLVPGDVLLIEIETLGDDANIGYPIEVAPLWFDAIRLASGYGVVVIEAAGNGDVLYVGRNLDQWSGDWQGVPTGRKLMPGVPDSDSGAIVVSGCVAAIGPPEAHVRMASQNYGQRVDCYAWGEKVYTAGYGDLNEGPTANQWYTPNFDGTSAASAIIAGAALLVQDMHEKSWGWRLSPAQLRQVLRDWYAGTKIVDASGTRIGVMPDLGQIAVKLGAVPDVYLRDSVNDAGVVPSTKVFQSPDIILRNAMIPNPGNVLGQGSQLANQVPANDPVIPNTDNYVYLRIRNRSGVAAPAVKADVYWSEASSLVAPIDWKPIGQINGGTIAGGGDLHVVGPLTWHPVPGKYPASGHGCLVAVLDQVQDPKPPSLPAAIGTTALGWDEFLRYVGANNNVAWRNFIVVPPAPVPPPPPWQFCIRGSWGEAREFELVLLAELPDQARLAWEAPRALGALMERAGGDRLHRGEATESGMRFELTGTGRLVLPSILLERRAEHRCQLHLNLPDRQGSGEGFVAIRQLYQGIPVGQLTWCIRSPEKERAGGEK